MKRILYILTMATLALTIVYLGAGTVVVECLKSNSLTVGIVGMDSCCDDSDDNCAQDSPCMKTTFVKLQPTIVAEQTTKIQAPVLSLHPLFCANSFSPSFSANAFHEVPSVVKPPHAPPRLYLAIIRVLKI